jgi:antirestriction protein
MADIEEMLAQSPEHNAEEWRIDDYENFYGYRISEYEHNLEKLSTIALAIAEHGAAFAAYIDWMEGNSDDIPTVEHFKECYKGHWESEKDFALKSEVVEETYNYNALPEFWQHHIDWDSVAEEIFMDSYHSARANQYCSESYGVYVFETNY